MVVFCMPLVVVGIDRNYTTNTWGVTRTMWKHVHSHSFCQEKRLLPDYVEDYLEEVKVNLRFILSASR
ncbi:hypothetical protein L873DRAFT_1215543 [Choiromyces venosus 120613-1]|uniref:Uncharacterized protein n=1 Tax=Choiromyces venosus 120613-1 TaxID=1336337 RepID=A0A3N4J3I8_9PEZI|nr:hypothetical protein L873DRAFT_1215543 [Choiromyces venosus 120613-1]